MKFTMNELKYISNMYEGISSISLMANLNVKEDGSELFSLMEKDVIKEDELEKSIRPIFNILANTRQSTKIYIKDRLWTFEKYAARAQEGLVLIEGKDGVLDMTRPLSLTSTMNEIKEWTGCATIKTGTLNGVYSYGELLTLTAFIDLYRILGLKAYLGDEIEVRGLTAYEIYNIIKNDSGNQLSNLLISNYQLNTMEMDELSEQIEKLIEKGCLVKGEDENGSATYELTEDYATYASGFLVPETLVTIEQMGFNEIGELVSSSCLCIGAGHRDWLLIAFGEEDAELATLSSDQLLRLLENLLECENLYRRNVES